MNANAIRVCDCIVSQYIGMVALNSMLRLHDDSYLLTVWCSSTDVTSKTFSGMGDNCGVIINAEWVLYIFRDEVGFIDESIAKIKRLEISSVKDLVEGHVGNLEDIGVSFLERKRFMKRVHSTASQPPPSALRDNDQIAEVLAVFKMKENVTLTQALIDLI